MEIYQISCAVVDQKPNCWRGPVAPKFWPRRRSFSPSKPRPIHGARHLPPTTTTTTPRLLLAGRLLRPPLPSSAGRAPSRRTSKRGRCTSATKTSSDVKISRSSSTETTSLVNGGTIWLSRFPLIRPPATTTDQRSSASLRLLAAAALFSQILFQVFALVSYR